MVNFKIVQSLKEIQKMVKFLSSKSLVACDVESSDLNIKKLELEGIGIGTSDIQYYIPVPNKIKDKEIIRAMNKILSSCEVIFHNAKFDLKVLKKYGTEWPEKIHDTMILSWLEDENRSHGLKPLTKEFLGREVKKWVDIDRSPSLFRDENDIIEELGEYCAEDVKNTYDLFEIFYPLVEEQNLLLDYNKIEKKIIKVLANMEYRGVMLDMDWLSQKKDEAEIILRDLKEQIIEVTGVPDMNINSPKQLEEFLFDKMGYEPIKTTPSGKRSTDGETLNTIVKKNKLGDDSAVALMLKFRDLEKVYSTYFVSLLELGESDGIIHTTFMQHGTRTGRLSSNTPNLQNIPSRDDQWNVRQAFIPRKGYRFIIADYSQIELRMLAHFSKDKSMMEVFNNDGDIHAKTMELTGTDRKTAKGINFGLIYGMGPRTLAHNLEIKEKEAVLYIERFFKGYPSVRKFIFSIQNRTLREGFVTMITGRKRRFHEYKDSKWFNSIARQAINTKVQGSAADLIKIAMIKLAIALHDVDAYQLIQIHDEIIVEANIKVFDEVKEIVRGCMETAIKLDIPLKVGIEEGDHWIKG